jgi:transcription-repair coupling factor (superfamily II helicase)
MIIEEAENFGLAQLYQLRGRIGREKQKAYCYLFYTPDLLTEDSEKRLRALQEFGELGSGFRLALRDLEIRGAGNILSAEQHGFVRDIGFELYSRLIDEMSKKVKGEKAKSEQKWETSIELLISAHIPDTYIEAEDLRIIFYRRLAAAKSEAEILAAKDELVDRFGPMPKPCENLLEVCKLKILAAGLKFRSIIEEESGVVLYLSEKIEFDPESVLRLAKDYEGEIEFLRGDCPAIRIKKEAYKTSLFAYLYRFLGNFLKYAVIK